MVQSPTIDRLLELRRRFVAPVAHNHGMDLIPETNFDAPPMVLLLGNHSSGKSSLINHLVGERVQRTGVAPTDDGFTILFHADEACTLDGKAITTSPKLPLAELTRFGPGLVEHLDGRGLPAELLQHVRLVDSPGMIDSGGTNAERPYDFPSVVRWFADQADLILLFFDPEKPGTTGETLTTLTESLAGVDHKLRIVMNKMDLFDGMRDFARTYGALCWNLSRNLPTKDLPHIYTTIIPNLVRENAKLPLDGFAAALLELESYIDELPGRRSDAVISRAIDEARLLHIRAMVTEELRGHIRNRRTATMAVGAMLGLASAAAAYVSLEQSMWYVVGFIVLALMLVSGSLWVATIIANFTERRGPGRLEEYFHQAFKAEILGQSHAEDLLHDWQHVRPSLQKALSGLGLAAIKRSSKKQIRQLQQTFKDEMPRLRR